MFFKCGHLTCLPCLRKYQKHIFMFENIFPCPICQQSCRLDKIYSYKVEKKKRPNSISMRKFKKAKFICTYAGCGKSYLLETIPNHEMFECYYRSILCPAQGCKFINNVETVIIHSINWPFQLLYCAICKSLYNVSVLIHDCNVIKSQRSIFFFKYYYENSPANYLHKDIFIRNNSYTETFEDSGKINFAMFMAVAISHPQFSSGFTNRILQRQNGVVDLSSPTTYNINWSYFCSIYFINHYNWCIISSFSLILFYLSM